jgi:CHAT domain-containing protein
MRALRPSRSDRDDRGPDHDAGSRQPLTLAFATGVLASSGIAMRASAGRALTFALIAVALRASSQDRERDVVELIRNRDFEGAFTQLSAAIAREPPSARLYKLFVDVAFLRGAGPSVQQIFEALAERYPTDPLPLYGLGLCLRRSHLPQGAAEALVNALERDPECIPALREYLLNARAAGRLPQAKEQLREWLRARREPSAPLLYAIGQAEALAYRYREAGETLARSLAIQPLPDAIRALAEVRTEEGRVVECDDWVTRGLDEAERRQNLAALKIELLLIRARCRGEHRGSRAVIDPTNEALAIATAAGDVDAEASVHTQLARLAHVDGRFEDSMRLAEEAARIHEALGEDASLAYDLFVLGMLPQASLSPLETTRATLLRSLALSKATGDRRTEARALGTLGSVLAGHAKPENALPYLFQTLDLVTECGFKRSQAVNANNISEVFEAIGDLDRAEEYGRLAARLYHEAEGPGLEASVLARLGDICGKRGDAACSLSYHQQAARVQASYGEPQQDVLLRLASDHEARGDVTRARAGYHEVLELARRHRDHHVEALALLAQAELELRGGRFREAAALFASGIAPTRGEAYEAETAIRGERGLAACARGLGDPAGALEHLRQAIRWVETLGSEIRLSALRTQYFSDKRGFYADAIDLLYDFHRAEPGAGHAREAFQIAEGVRARTLLELVSGERHREAAFQKERIDIRERLSRIQAMLFKGGLSRAEEERLENARTTQEKRLGELDMRARRTTPAGWVRTQPLRRAAALRAIPAHGIVVEFLLSAKRSYVFVSDARGSLAFEALAPRAEIEEKARALRSEISKRPAARKTFGQNSTVALYRALFGPVRQLVETARSITIVPDGLLFYVPFEALAPAAGAPYLGERADVAYAPSLAVLAALDERRPTANPGPALLAFGDPRVGPSREPGRATATQPRRELGRQALEREGFSFAPLPASLTEVQSIVQVIGARDSTLVTGAAFKERTVVAELERSRRYVHFATHAVLDENVPSRSGIVVSGGPDVDAGEDGLLQAGEIADLNLSSDLVTLSACQTGLGKRVDGEGILGLAHAFETAGARSLVVSLWNVNDFSTSQFMAAFYRALKAGMPKAGALRAARAEVLRSANPLLRHPYYWAGFVLIGP